MDNPLDNSLTHPAKDLALRITAGPDEGKTFTLQEGFLGTGSTCTYCLTDPGIDRMHVRIAKRRDAWQITDLTSAPDIRVNNSIIKSRRISYGDTIQIAGTSMQVVSASSVSEPPAAVQAKKAPEPRNDKPPSQTMQISLDDKAADWKPGKPTKKEPPKPEAATEKRKVPTPEPITKRRPVTSAPPARSQAVNTGGVNEYRAKAVKKSGTPDKKNMGPMIFLIIFVAIMVPVLLAGISMSNKKKIRMAVGQAYNEAKAFEEKNPESYRDAITRYMKVAEIAAAHDPSIANLARERAAKLTEDENKYAERLEAALAQLDTRSREFEEQNKFSAALNVYESYLGSLKGDIFAARAKEIERLRAEAAKEEAANAPPEPDTEAEAARKAAAERAAKQQAAQAAAAKVSKITANAAELVLSENTGDAITEIEKILHDDSLSGYRSAAEQAVNSLRILSAVDRTMNLATGDDHSDPADDIKQPDFVRLVYSLRKDDLLAAQVLVNKIRGTLLYKDLAERSKMSDAELKKERAAIADFAKIWSALVGSSTRTVPRPDDCIAKLEEARKGKNPKNFTDFCNSMTKLKAKYPDSRFIARYDDVFSVCGGSTQDSPPVKRPPAKLASTGNAKITGSDARTYTFEALDPIPEPEKGKVALFSVEDVFMSPGSTTPVGARLDTYALIPYKKTEMTKGSFDMPMSLPGKTLAIDDQIYVGDDAERGTRIVCSSATSQKKKIYKEDFGNSRGSKWKVYNGSFRFTDNSLPLDIYGSALSQPAGVPNFWFSFDLKDPVVIDMVLTRETDSELVITLGCLQFVLAGAGKLQTGVWIDGHMSSQHNIPPLPLKQPIQIAIKWDPIFSSVTVAGQTMTGVIDATRRKTAPRRIGFLARGKCKITKFEISDQDANLSSEVIGINEEKTAVLIAKGSSDQWKSLEEGGNLFLLNTKAAGQFDAIPATVTHANGSFAVCRIGNGTSVSSSTTASLTPNPGASAGVQAKSAGILPSSGWKPAAVYANIVSGQDGKPVILPDLPCSYAPLGFVAPINRTVEHPFTHEPIVTFPGEALPAKFTEESGLLLSQIIPAITASGAKEQPVLLTASSAPQNAMILLNPNSFTVDPRASAQGWSVEGGQWTTKLQKFAASGSTSDVAVATSHSPLWENFQYTATIQVDAASKSETAPEIILELYSPLWGKSLALVAGTHAVSIEFDKLVERKNRYSVNNFAAAPVVDMAPKWSKAYSSKKPKLEAGKSYDVKIRHAGNDFAFYINGKRLAVVNYPGLDGDLYLRAACAGGQMSIGSVTGTMLSRSTRIPSSEPELGEFGYVLAADGANLLVDPDTRNLAKGASISIMKIDNAGGGKGLTLRRVATGTITDITTRLARALAPRQSEPVTPGMKVIMGHQPAELLLSPEQLASIEEGL